MSIERRTSLESVLVYFLKLSYFLFTQSHNHFKFNVKLHRKNNDFSLSLYFFIGAVLDILRGTKLGKEEVYF